jgi:hypothetical protein
MDALAAAAPDFAVRFPLSTALMNADDRRSPTVPDDHDAPVMERAARDNLRRSVELLLAGAARQPRD